MLVRPVAGGPCPRGHQSLCGARDQPVRPPQPRETSRRRAGRWTAARRGGRGLRASASTATSRSSLPGPGGSASALTGQWPLPCRQHLKTKGRNPREGAPPSPLWPLRGAVRPRCPEATSPRTQPRGPRQSRARGAVRHGRGPSPPVRELLHPLASPRHDGPCPLLQVPPRCWLLMSSGLRSSEAHQYRKIRGALVLGHGHSQKPKYRLTRH